MPFTFEPENKRLVLPKHVEEEMKILREKYAKAKLEDKKNLKIFKSSLPEIDEAAELDVNNLPSERQ